jgi:hypothetical protein
MATRKQAETRGREGSRRRIKDGCSGDPCWAVGSAFQEIPGSCRRGIPRKELEALIQAALDDGRDAASEDCEGEDCACIGRFRHQVIEHAEIEDDGEASCVWWVAGVWEGKCHRDGTAPPPPVEPRPRIRTRTDRSARTLPRPDGECDERACRGLASAQVTIAAAPDEGMDSDLMNDLIDAAAEAAEKAATRRCPAKDDCKCVGDFYVTSSGVHRARIAGQIKHTWWVGGYWKGRCLPLV